MPIRLESMGAVNVSPSNQTDLKDIEWLTRGIEETLQLQQHQHNHCETGHRLKSVSPSASSMPSRHPTFSGGNQAHVPIDHDNMVIPTKPCKSATTSTWLPYVLPSVRDRHLNRVKSNWRHGNFNSNDNNNKWVVKRLNHKNVVSKRRKNYVYIEDVRTRNGCNTDYRHHQKLLSTQTLIQEAVRRLYGLHRSTGSTTINDSNNNNNPNSSTIMTTITTNNNNSNSSNNNNGTTVGHNGMVSVGTGSCCTLQQERQQQQLLLFQQNSFRDKCELFCDVTV